MDKTGNTAHIKTEGKYIKKHGYGFFEEDVNRLYEFLKETNIAVIEDKAAPQELIEVAKQFHLLPVDALIVLTCGHHRVDTILTFDENFKRIPRLEVLP